MKKLITLVCCTGCMFFISFHANAQTVKSEVGTAIDPKKPAENKKPSTTVASPEPAKPVPQIITATALKTIQAEAPKAIIPGGDYKPIDTRIPVPATAAKKLADQYPEKASIVAPALPVFAAPTPVAGKATTPAVPLPKPVVVQQN